MDPSEDRIVRLIADPHNRAILAVLNDAAQSLTVSELAERLVGQETDVFETTGTGDDLEEISISLHHNYLPKLDEIGLVDYDRDAAVVVYENYPTVDAEWMEMEVIDELLTCLGPNADAGEDAIGVIEGKEDVLDYGRHLADEAEEELFLMYLSEELLEEKCLHHVENAIDRDVNVSLGSEDPDMSELVRERLPEVTIWEPQLDVMGSRSQYPQLGRLVFADREKLLLAILKESARDGMITETAIVGEGESNPLVVLVRELLGPRLDHLDYQSEDFLDELPFES